MSKVKYLHYDRHLGIGGSDANVIMKGEWKNLWEIKTQRKEADNLDDVLPVQIGTITEKLNCRWLAKSIGSNVEDYHQEYYKNNSNQPYCKIIIEPKLQKARELLNKYYH